MIEIEDDDLEKLGGPKISIGRIASSGSKMSIRRRLAKRTNGSLKGADRGFVYAGQHQSGRIKIGMSTDYQRRCRELHVEPFYAIPVVGDAALDVETAVLSRLGALQHDDEWVMCDKSLVIAAMIGAAAEVARRRHVDPSITAEEARRRRIAACKHAGDGLTAELASDSYVRVSSRSTT